MALLRFFLGDAFLIAEGVTVDGDWVERGWGYRELQAENNC